MEVQMKKKLFPLAIIATFMLCIVLLFAFSVPRDTVIFEGEQIIEPENEIDFLGELAQNYSQDAVFIIDMNHVEYRVQFDIPMKYIDPDVMVTFDDDDFAILNRQRGDIVIYSIRVQS